MLTFPVTRMTAVSCIIGQDIHMAGVSFAALGETGAVTAQAANDVAIENGYNEATDDYGLKFEVSGFLSSTTTTIKSHDESKTATGSTISGDTVNIISGGNTKITGSDVVGANDVNLVSGKDILITSAEEKEKQDYEKQVEKSGLLSGGGLGFFIGSEERNDQYQDADTIQRGSTVGSISGNVNIAANKDIHVEASDVIAGKNISLAGENVEITSKDNVYHSDEKHEYKKSGLGVSIGGSAINAVESVSAPVKRMTEVSDSRLKALYAYETAEKIKENGNALKAVASGNFMPTISVSIGSSESKYESHSTVTEARGSTLQAGQDVTIKTKEDLTVKGSDIVGNNVNLEAGKDIHILAAEEKQTLKTDQSSQGSSIGVTFSAGSMVSINGNFYSGKDKENGSETAYKGSNVTVADKLTMKSGQDTDIIGSTVSGNKVNVDVGRNLDIQSLQMKKEYNEESTFIGGGFSVGGGKTSYSAGASRGNMDSNYESVSNQAGIYAGEEGFDITVKENTSLKGGVIDSKATSDKNTLTTGTLTWEDTENKADYKAGGVGVSYASNDKSSALNQRGLTPNLTPTVKGDAGSTTKSTIAEGTITITDKDHQKQDVSALNRDTKNGLNQLQEIFDRSKVEEKQELVGMLEKYGNQVIHKYSERKGWEDGSIEKTLLHGAFGALMGDMAGGSAATGALAGGVNEYVMGYLTKTKGEDWVQKHPDAVQWISAGVGTAVGKLADGDMAEAVDIALTATKWNKLAYEKITTSRVKELLCKTTGKQMTDEEIRGLLYDLVLLTNGLDPEGAQSSDWELGNEETTKEVKECLKKHSISDENIAAFLEVYTAIYNEAVAEDSSLPQTMGEITYSEKGTPIFTLTGITVIAERMLSFSQDAEHTDMYEAYCKQDRESAAQLAQARLELGTQIAAEYPVLADVLYSQPKGLGFIGAAGSAIFADTPIASKFLAYGLSGSGKTLTFEHGSDVSTNLEKSDVLKLKVEEFAQHMQPGETKYISTSLDFNLRKEVNGKYTNPSLDQQLAYGKVSLAICIQKDGKGNISYSGRVADTYDFDWHNANPDNDLKENIKLVMNNGAVVYQKIGALQPFNWKASVKGRI